MTLKAGFTSAEIREGAAVTVPASDRSQIAEALAAERVTHDAETARVQQRIRELEQSNEALGKAVGLLHAMNEHEPGATPTTNEPSDSSPPKTSSSDSWQRPGTQSVAR